MKKVLYYVSTFPVFSQNFITRELEALVQGNKVDLSILSLKPGVRVDLPEILKSRVYYFTRPKILRILDALKYLAVNPFAFKLLTKYRGRWRSYITALSLSKKVREINPDLIVGNWLTEGALIANMLSDLTFVPYFIQAHAEDIWLSSKEWIFDRVKKSHGVFTCTQNNADYLQSILPKDYSAKIQTIYHYLKPDLFQQKTAPHNQVPVIYLVGRMVEKKGFSYMIEAANILKGRGLNFKVRIAGDPGTQKGKLIEQVKTLNLTHTVEILNEVTFDEHSHNYLESDIFVAPSISASDGNLDGIPNVMLEAMLAGLAVVATRVSAIPEVLVDGENGFLVDEKDSRGLADKLEILIKDASIILKMGQAGRNRVLEQFGYKNTVAKLEELLITS